MRFAVQQADFAVSVLCQIARGQRAAGTVVAAHIPDSLDLHRIAAQDHRNRRLRQRRDLPRSELVVGQRIQNDQVGGIVVQPFADIAVIVEPDRFKFESVPDGGLFEFIPHMRDVPALPVLLQQQKVGFRLALLAHE